MPANSIDTSELDREYDGLKDRLSQTAGAKNRLADQMDHLSVSDKNYDKKYNDMQERLDKLYDKFTDLEKKTFLKSFLSDVFIYEEEQKDGRILKGLRFKFPIYMNGRNVLGVDWDNESTDETVVLLSHKKPDGHINVKVEFGEGEGKVPLDNIAKRAEEYKPKERVTYKMIKEYIEAKYGFKVHTAYIAEVKRDLGLPMYDAPNAVEELKQPRKHPTAEKVEAIKDALKHFEVI